MLLTIPILTLTACGLLLWIAANPSRLVYLLPLLLAFEYRVRLGIFSIDFAEMCVVVAFAVWLMRSWGQPAPDTMQRAPRETIVILLLTICALPSIFFESNISHAASVYRDLMMPFLFFSLFLRSRLEPKQIHTLIKLACLLGIANACIGVLQYSTGEFLWFAGAEEAEWQSYKIGLARLSIFGEFLAPANTLPTGLYTGANNFACYLSLPLCLVSTLVFTRGIGKRLRLLCLAASLVLFAGLLLTIFRSGLLVYAASMMLVFLLLNPQKVAARVAVVVALTGLIAFLFLAQGVLDWDQFGSFQGRQEMMSDAMYLIKAHPEVLLTGGFSDFYFSQSREAQEIHNLALYSVVHYGLAATLLLFSFFIRFLWRVKAIAGTASGPERNVLVAVAASVAANVFLYGASTMLIDSVQTSIWLLFWVGIGCYLIQFRECQIKNQPERFLAPSFTLPIRGEPA